MNRAVASALVSAGGFAAGHVTPLLLFMAVHYSGREPPTGPRAAAPDEYILLFYFTGVYALASCAAYTALTAVSPYWRSRPQRQAAAISAAAGAAAQLLYWTGLSVLALMPLVHVLPHAVALWIGTAMPGIIVGLVVLLWSAARKA